MKTLELTPQFDSRASFYGKARIEFDGLTTNLISYETKVATVLNGEVEVFGTYSSTTLRHIKEFLLQRGFKAETKAQIEKDYIK